MIIYSQIINEKTKQCDIAIGDDAEYYKSIGMIKRDVEQGYDGNWYIKGYAPAKPAPTHEEIRIMRQDRFSAEADPIRYSYEEALARGEATAEELKQEWLAKKEEIRADLPYPEE